MTRYVVGAAALVAVVVIVMVAVAFALQANSDPTGEISPAIEDAESRWILDPDETVSVVPASPESVVDGDSVIYRLADGTFEEVRMIGIDAPEMQVERDKYGVEASQEVAYLLRQQEQVFLEIGAADRDKYGKLLAYVWLKRPDARPSAADVRTKMLNARMLITGFAREYQTRPGVVYANVRYADLFRVYASEAKKAERGLWDPGFAARAGPSSWLNAISRRPPITSVYVGNATSRKFHLSNCKNALKMRVSNRVPFDTLDAAFSEGYVPCGICIDPTSVPITSAYVGNATSRKFHVSSCENAQKMRVSNRVPFEGRQAALDEGYIPCKICDP